jgi:hypothetical protein
VGEYFTSLCEFLGHIAVSVLMWDDGDRIKK